MKKTSTIATLPKIGRPIKMPSKSALDRLVGVSIVVEDVRKILNESRRKNPSFDDNIKGLKGSVCLDVNKKPVVNFVGFEPVSYFYSDDEVDLILRFFRLPKSFDAIRECEFYKKEAINDAINFTKLFTDAPYAMIAAMPKIQKRLAKFYSGSGEKRLVQHYCFLKEMEKFWGENSFSSGFWNESTKNFVCTANAELNTDKITEKMVEKARAELSRKLKSFPRKSAKVG